MRKVTKTTMYQELDYSKIEFVAYIRKSSEGDERQALSIDSQNDRILRIARDMNIKLRPDRILRESKSAKKANSRPVFQQMVKDIEKKRIQGIITWSYDRLSRNALDAAKLVDLMDQGILKCIVTNEQIFKNSPGDKQMFTIFGSVAKAENDHKGENVKRGLLKKRQMGYPPGMAKIGYVNDRGEKGYRKTLIDNERFPIVKKVFEMFETGKYTVRELHRIAVSELGLTSVQRKRMGGKPVKLSIFYNMLQDPFYAGFFIGKDENEIMKRYEVNKSVPRIITEEEHEKIVSMIHRRGLPRACSHRSEFPYKRFSICGDCGGSITAERKKQMICKSCKKKFALAERKECPFCHKSIVGKMTGKVLDYTHYHCTKKKDLKCPGGSIQEKNIDSFFVDNLISKIAISPALKDWCINSLKVLEHREGTNEEKIKENWIGRLQNLKEQRERLISAHVKGNINEEDFITQKARIEEETDAVEAKTGVEKHSGKDIETIDKKFNILTEIRNVIKKGTYDEKVEALSVLGSNLTFKEKKLSITNDIFCSTLQKYLSVAKSKNPQFEPENIEDISDRNEVFVDIRPIMLPG